jgi:hypothetical protein
MSLQSGNTSCVPAHVFEMWLHVPRPQSSPDNAIVPNEDRQSSASANGLNPHAGGETHGGKVPPPRPNVAVGTFLYSQRKTPHEAELMTFAGTMLSRAFQPRLRPIAAGSGPKPYALANKGRDTGAIQGWLGHRSITSTAGLHRSGAEPVQGLLAGIVQDSGEPLVSFSAAPAMRFVARTASLSYSPAILRVASFATGSSS